MFGMPSKEATEAGLLQDFSNLTGQMTSIEALKPPESILTAISSHKNEKLPQTSPETVNYHHLVNNTDSATENKGFKLDLNMNTIQSDQIPLHMFVKIQ